MPIEELDRYFLSPSVDQTSSLISSHLEIVREHFYGMFPINHAILTILHKSLLRVAKSADPLVFTEVKEACQHLAVKLETLVF